MAVSLSRPGEGTRGRILEELAVAPRTAKDLAKSIGIQESAARGHLERLEERGLVSPAFLREGVGRPRKRYSLTTSGLELFPRRYELLLDSLIEELIEREGDAYVSVLFAQAARRLAKEVAMQLPAGAPVEQRAKLLANSLNDLGFRSTVEQGPTGELTIVRNNCVFRHSAIGHAYLLCEVFDKHLTEELLGQSGVNLKDSISRGGMRCTHLIQLS
ncbi:MAG: ArsR family transcriptional regulator [Thermoplasmata archaeon]|nr:ArsR family transcriptional regulator [Thermoplasmata archaeon]MCI4341496.1 ArsR family transcriptional regulator [Thermoplasmata archaeon]